LIRNKHIINQFCWAGILFFLFIPLIKNNLFPGRERPLYGSYSEKETQCPGLTKRNWWNGTFQDSLNDYVNEHFGFRKTLVRLRNQVSWSLSKISYANGVEGGKDDYLFDIKYINAYRGKDFVGLDSIRARVARVKLLQEKLAEAGIKFFVVLAPGKASYYNDYLPEDRREIVGPTNYVTYREEFSEQKVHCLDFRKWFEEMKPKAKYKLFPKCGIHWSRYGATIAADSMIRYVAHRTNPLSLFEYKGVKLTDSMRYSDYDVGQSMNLIWDILPDTMAYPNVYCPPPLPGSRPRMLMVGDSYFWTMPTFEMQTSAFNQIDFMYYNRQWFPRCDGTYMKDVSEISLIDQLLKQDVISILVTDANLSEFPWGFVDQALNALATVKDIKTQVREAHIRIISEGIRRDQNWLEGIRKQAFEKNISEDSCVHLNAIWVFDNLHQPTLLR
jgi:hypothetical protein